MSRFAPPLPQDLSPTQQRLYGQIVTRIGRDSPRIDAEGRLDHALSLRFLSPEIGIAMEGMIGSVAQHLSLTDRCREIAILATAYHERSTYESAAHERIARGLGLSDDELRAVARGDADALAAPVERLTLAVATSLLETNGISDDLYVAAGHQVEERGLYEIAAVVGFYRFVATQLSVFEVAAPNHGTGDDE